LQALVATGYGVALVSRMARRPDLKLAFRPVRHRQARRTVHALRRSDGATDLTLTFECLLQSAADDLT
jgi:DNA-binding transcriptional LysR family regulator